MSGERVEVTAGPEDAGERLDKVLARHLPELSRTRLQDLIRAGQVSDGDEVLLVPNGRVAAGDMLLVDLPSPAPADPLPEAIPLTILYEDDVLIVIDKPAGLVVHPAPGHSGGTLVNALLAHCGASLSGIGGVRRPGIVHRLDKDTTGVMVVAKSDRAHQGLARQFADHGRTGKLERSYVAFVWGVPASPRFTIDAPIGRDPRSRLRMAVTPAGKEAVTHVMRERMFGTPPLVTRLACRLETGRTHQIRVHLADSGHPLLGDEVYGAGFFSKSARLDGAAATALAALGRQALHAATLGFDHPISGEFLSFSSPLPADLETLEAALTRM